METTNELQKAIIDLWHISRTAFAGSAVLPSRYDRMQYVKRELIKGHANLITGLSAKRIWFAIEDAIN